MNNIDILLFVNDLTFYKSHRKDLFNFLSANQKTEVITDTQGLAQSLISENENHNLKITNFSFNKTSLGLIKNIKYIFSVFKIIKQKNSNHTIFISNKFILIGAILNILTPIKKRKIYFFFSGLGYLFISQAIKPRILKTIFLIILKRAIRSGNIQIVVQNNDDYKFLHDKLACNKTLIHLIQGNGIPLQAKSDPQKSFDIINILFAGRLLKDKGIFEYLLAVDKIIENNKYTNIKFHIAGDCDLSNPNSITLNELDKIKLSTSINYLGRLSQEDLIRIFKQSHIFVLPSYREGLPRAALEAASCGMALILSDVPGCRECVQNNFNGFLFDLSSETDLSDKISFLLENQITLKDFCSNSPTHMKNYFSTKVIYKKFQDLLS